jgi:AcrR family transcriptional regulator
MARPARLTRAAIVEAALALVDEHGIDGLTMRALAKRLGVDPMAVYRHVRDKDALLGAMCDAVIAGLGPLRLDAPWREEVARLATDLHDVLVARPALVPVMTDAPMTPASVVVARDAIELLAGQGVPEELATAAFGLIFSYVLGFAVVEHGVPPPAAGAGELRAGALAELGRDEEDPPPHLDAALALLGDQGDFALGLDLLLDGVERRAAERRR